MRWCPYWFHYPYRRAKVPYCSLRVGQIFIPFQVAHARAPTALRLNRLLHRGYVHLYNFCCNSTFSNQLPRNTIATQYGSMTTSLRFCLCAKSLHCIYACIYVNYSSYPITHGCIESFITNVSGQGGITVLNRRIHLLIATEGLEAEKWIAAHRILPLYTPRASGGAGTLQKLVGSVIRNDRKWYDMSQYRDSLRLFRCRQYHKRLL